MRLKAHPAVTRQVGMIENSDQKIAEKIFQFTDLNGKVVLEIGCGNGRVTSLLADRSASLIAVDPDPVAIEEARRVVPGVDFRIGSGEKLDFSNRWFDLVLFTLSLHHQDSESALCEAQRVLKKDGEILVIEPDAEGEVERVFAVVHNEDAAKQAAQQSIQKSGLQVRYSEYFGATWTFTDKNELCHYLHAYYQRSFDPAAAAAIETLLGDKADDRPVELQDRMIIQSLKVV